MTRAADPFGELPKTGTSSAEKLLLGAYFLVFCPSSVNFAHVIAFLSSPKMRQPPLDRAVNNGAGCRMNALRASVLPRDRSYKRLFPSHV